MSELPRRQKTRRALLLASGLAASTLLGACSTDSAPEAQTLNSAEVSKPVENLEIQQLRESVEMKIRSLASQAVKLPKAQLEAVGVSVSFDRDEDGNVTEIMLNNTRDEDRNSNSSNLWVEYFEPGEAATAVIVRSASLDSNVVFLSQSIDARIGDEKLFIDGITPVDDATTEPAQVTEDFQAVELVSHGTIQEFADLLGLEV